MLVHLQEEVDVQTRRARAAEKAFVSLYRELYVAPDPVPALQTAENESRFTFIVHLHEHLNTIRMIHCNGLYCHSSQVDRR